MILEAIHIVLSTVWGMVQTIPSLFFLYDTITGLKGQLLGIWLGIPTIFLTIFGIGKLLFSLWRRFSE